jgi:hypothetical protein
MGEVLTALNRLARQERCPWCGCEPGDDTVHRDHCPTIDTCGQIGPPWNLAELHPDTEPHPRSFSGEPLADYTARCRLWWDAYYRHRREAHGLSP